MLPQITILDGGMGGELIRRGSASRTELWSARALLEAPEDVLAVHRDYIAAGARLIITNTYSTIPSYLGKVGLEARYVELTDLGGRLARQAADAAAASGCVVQVAGSLPPLAESYRADMVPADEIAEPIYRELVQALLPHVDLFICETMSSAREAANAVTAASTYGQNKPVYVSWTLDERPGHGLRSGESLDEALAALTPFNPAALLFNCTSPEAIVVALEELRVRDTRPLGAYPNLLHIPQGWTLDDTSVQSGRREMSLDEYVGFARTFVKAGATLVGGCCGIGPEYIRALARAAL